MKPKTSKKQNERTTGKEQYYTPTDVAVHCTKKMIEVIRNPNVIWLEPAGGTGQFIKAMEDCGVDPEEIVSYDIEPLHPHVTKTTDFLSEKIGHLKGCVVLTNPPFGRANSLSIPFFNHCSTVADYIGFLVPKSWRKWSVEDKLNPYFHKIYDEEIKADFIYPDTEDGKDASKGKLATVFQIWERRDDARDKVSVEDRGYITKTTPEEADVSLTVFGRGCGTVKTDFERVPNTTQMFLKINKEGVLEALKSVDFGRFFNNVAFVEALSIKEINYLLNEYHDKKAS